jgi:hypothetical protein
MSTQHFETFLPLFSGLKPVFTEPVITGKNRGKNHLPAKTANPDVYIMSNKAFHLSGPEVL